MTSQEATKVTLLLAAVFDVPAWSDEHMVAFESAIADLPYDSAREAAVRWIRTQSRRPLPADIREIARTIEPTRKALPAPLDRPKAHRREDVGRVEMLADGEKAKILRSYARSVRATSVTLGRVNPETGEPLGVQRADLAYEAIRLGLDNEDVAMFLAEDSQQVPTPRGGPVSEVVAAALAGRNGVKP